MYKTAEAPSSVIPPPLERAPRTEGPCFRAVLHSPRLPRQSVVYRIGAELSRELRAAAEFAVIVLFSSSRCTLIARACLCVCVCFF